MGDLKALLFDCDGVIAETERDGHRVSFNRAFKEQGIPVEWSIEEYAELLKIAGGKERMKDYFSNYPKLIEKFQINNDDIKRLHELKTEIFMNMSANGELPIRQGIKRIVKEAHDRGILLAVCSTSNEKSVTALVEAVMGKEGLGWFDAIFAGDVVKAKKPAPDIYNLAKNKWGLQANECFVVEDTRNGLLAAKAAGMHCIVTVSFYSMGEDFKEADLVVSSLGDPNMDAIEYFNINSKLMDKPEYIMIDNLTKMI